MQRIIYPLICALILVAGVYFVAGKDKSPETTTDNFYSTTSPQNTMAQPTEQPKDNSSIPAVDLNLINKQTMNATMHTSMGDITIELNPETPKTTENFIKLARAGFYDGTKFHRVIAGFMNQGGDPLTKDDSQMARWGTGGPGYQFADEIGSNNRNAVGTISMANSGVNTNGSQFFLNAGDNSFLDPKHTVFGKVTKGMDVLMAINGVKTTGAPYDRPLTPVIIKGIDIK